MIFIAGISIALFISALLLAKKDKSKSDNLLLIWMVIQAIHLSFFYLFNTNQLYQYPFLLGLQFPLPLLHGVFLFYYVSAVTNQYPKKKFTFYLHLIPALIAFIYLIPYMCLPALEKIEIFKNNGKGYETFQSVLIMATFLSGIIYFIWSLLLLAKHKKRIRNQFSTIEEINLNWLRLLIYGLGFVWALVIITQNDSIIYVGVSVFVILIGFFGIQQREIFHNPKPSLEPILKEERIVLKKEKKEDTKKEKYAHSGLTDEVAEKQYNQLLYLMNDQKLFKNSELSLSQLAGELDIHPNYLSQIINEKEDKSFYDFVNAFRVEEFKRLITIEENKKFTLLTLAFECGFNSKSSFNRHFKKLTGQTPSVYAKSV